MSRCGIVSRSAAIIFLRYRNEPPPERPSGMGFFSKTRGEPVMLKNFARTAGSIFQILVAMSLAGCGGGEAVGAA